MINRKYKITVLIITSILYLLLLQTFVPPLWAQNRFEHLTIKDGLSNNSVNHIIQSDNGFLWFSTLNGLSRYDGKEMRNFSYEPGTPTSLSSNRIYDLFEDDWNYIWLLTYEFHLLRFDPQSERFIDLNQQIPTGVFKAKERVDIYSSSPSVIWFASQEGGIIRVQQKKNTEDFIIDYFKVGKNTPSDKETFIYEDSKKRIWIGTQKGLIRMENDSIRFSSLTMSSQHILDTTLYFTSCVEDASGSLILGTTNHGLFEYLDGKLKKWNTIADSTLNIQGLQVGKNKDIIVLTQEKGLFHIDSYHQVTHYPMHQIKTLYKTYCDKTGTFWISGSERGITMLNPETKVLHHYNLNSKLRESQGDPDKPKFLEDSKGNLWIAVYGGGLCKFNREKQEFEYFCHQKSNSGSLSSNFVLSLFEDRSENLWIGTFKNGLNKLDLSGNEIPYHELVKNATFESQNEVRGIAEDEKGRIWLGTKYGNIYCCDKNNNVIFRIPEDLTNKNDYKRSNVYALITDGKDLWVGTKGNGLYRIKNILDFKKYANRRFPIEVYQHKDEDPHSLTNNDIFALFQDQYRQIWVGTYHGGLNVIKNPDDTIKFEHYKSDVADSSCLSDDRIRKIYMDHNNNLWIGTVYGLNFLDSKYLKSDEKHFKCFYKDPTTANSLANNDIFDIHQDQNGIIWVATYGGGLNSINVSSETKTFNHFFRKDGLPSNIVFSILEDQHSNLWLGTDNGIGKFSTQTFSSELIDNDDGFGHGVFSEGCKHKAKNNDLILGTLNGFVRFNPDSITPRKKELPMVLTGFELFDEVVLPGSDNSPLKVSINKTKELRLKHYQNFIGINFAVMDFSSPEKIQYSYILENYDKNWNKALAYNNARYKALPPGEYLFKLKATDSRGVLLDQTRELSIIISPPFWKTTWAYLLYLLFLAGILYVISKELRLRNKIRYETKLSEEKFKFFTNISHEFKTPLTLISNSTDDILKATSFTKEVKSSIQLIKRNVQSLNGLIEQLISFRRLQKGKIDLQVKQIEIISYLNDIYLTFLPYAEKKELKFTFDTNVKSFEGVLDVRYTDIIINNLLSNAFKHTPPRKKVTFSAELTKKSERIIIKVKDQGEGISPEYIDKIFERFVFLENDSSSGFRGSGIGLSLAKEMVNLHKGNIKLESKINEGSTFTVDIPVAEKYYDIKEIAPEHEDVFTQQPKPFYSFIESSDEYHETQHKKSANAIKPKLLIIDNNRELLEYLEDKLKKDNTVFIAKNGEEGLKLSKEVEPDLVLSDLKMPKINGFELTKLLKSDFKTSHIPIILLTASSTVDNKIEGLDSGADDYITKPFNMDYLKRRIANIINQRKQLKEKFAQDPEFMPEKLSTSNRDQRFLTKVISLIETNIKTPGYTINDMYVELGYSRSVFFRKMKSVSGYPPKEFVRIVKMKKAAELLRKPGATVTEVSFNVGFSDTDYFRKSFRNFFGETPSSYQKKYGQ